MGETLKSIQNSQPIENIRYKETRKSCKIYLSLIDLQSDIMSEIRRYPKKMNENRGH